MAKYRIRNHLAPGSTFWTPEGFVTTDADGVADITEQQAKHLSNSCDVQLLEKKPFAQPAIKDK